MKKAIFPGSFDPFHRGHEFVIREALKDFDFLYIIISFNENKKRFQEFEKTYSIIKKKYEYDKKIKVLINRKKLMVEIAKELNCFDFVRGIRNNDDMIYEINIKDQYRLLDNRINFHYYWNDKDDISSTKIRNNMI